MRRQDEDTDTATNGAGGLSAVLPEVQIRLRDPVQGRKNRRDQTARCLDVAQTMDRSVLRLLFSGRKRYCRMGSILKQRQEIVPMDHHFLKQ